MKTMNANNHLLFIFCFFVWNTSLHAIEKIDPQCSPPPEIIKEMVHYVFFDPDNQLAIATFDAIYDETKSLNKAMTYASYAKWDKCKFTLSNFGLKMTPENISHYEALTNKLTPKCRATFLDRLYEQKYSSPLWQHVKEISDEKDYTKRDITAIQNRIEKWRKEDAAEQLYQTLHKKNDPDNRYYNTSCANNRSRTITTRSGKTEMPLTLALAYFRNSAESGDYHPEINLYFTSPITALHDIDIVALQMVDHESIDLHFSNIAKDATISPRIIDLNNTRLFCNTLPIALEPLVQKGCNPYQTFYDHKSNCVSDNYSDYACYYNLGSYWRTKIIAKTALVLGALYLFKKYLWDECFTFDYEKKQLIEQAKITAFNTEIKPLLTPEVSNALQVEAHYRSLPNPLAQEVGTLHHTVSVNPTSLAHACDVITKTNTILESAYSIDPLTINTPLNLHHTIGATLMSALFWIHPLPWQLGGGIVANIFDLLCRKKNFLETHSCSYSYSKAFMHFFYTKPAAFIKNIIALPVSFIKPQWLPYLVDPHLEIIVPKENQQTE